MTNDLQDAINEVPTSDILVVAGDWNARTGPVDDATRQILGRFALGPRCANGERLVDLAAANHLVVSSTRFQHRRRTWKPGSPMMDARGTRSTTSSLGPDGQAQC